MSGHTPGPLKAHLWTADGVEYATLTDANGNDTCSFFYTDETPHENCHANATLYSAAPDLLETLRGIANAKPKEWDDADGDNLQAFYAWAQSRARYAVAKAEGPQ